MKMQSHPKLDIRMGNASANATRNAVTAAILFVCMLPCSAKAQFSGPALGTTAPINLPVTPTTDPAILYPANRDIVLEQGDLLAVHVYGATDYQPEARVSLDGTVQLPLIGNLHVDGLTLPQAENLIAERLSAAGMYRSPQVSIQLAE